MVGLDASCCSRSVHLKAVYSVVPFFTHSSPIPSLALPLAVKLLPLMSNLIGIVVLRRCSDFSKLSLIALRQWYLLSFIFFRFILRTCWLIEDFLQTGLGTLLDHRLHIITPTFTYVYILYYQSLPAYIHRVNF